MQPSDGFGRFPSYLLPTFPMWASCFIDDGKRKSTGRIFSSLCCAGLSSVLWHTGGFCARRKREKPRSITPIALMSCRSGSVRPAKPAYLLPVGFAPTAVLRSRRGQNLLQCFAPTAASRFSPFQEKKRPAFAANAAGIIISNRSKIKKRSVCYV